MVNSVFIVNGSVNWPESCVDTHREVSLLAIAIRLGRLLGGINMV